MNCRCCGRPTRNGNAGQATRIVRWYADDRGTIAEMLCWTCFTWGTPGSPSWGKVYAVR